MTMFQYSKLDIRPSLKNCQLGVTPGSSPGGDACFSH